MPTPTRVWICCLAIGCSPAWAAPTIEYVERLEENGMADLALDYWRDLTARGAVPAELADEADYHLARAYESAAEQSFSPSREQLEEQALASYEKYLAEHASGARTLSARTAVAGLRLREAETWLARANSLEAKDPKQPSIAENRQRARQQLERLRPIYEQSIEEYRQQLASERAKAVAERTKRQQRRARELGLRSDAEQRLEAEVVTTELQQAMVEYLIGLSHDSTREADARIKQLGRASALFDAVFQRYRASGAALATLALLWHGRVEQERGERELAGDIYREVLAAEPAHVTGLTHQQASIYAQARLFWYQLQNASGSPTEVLDNPHYAVEPWVIQSARDRTSPLVLGVQLEWAKALLATALSLKTDDPARRRQLREGVELLDRYVCRYASEVQAEGFALREKYRKELPTDDSMPASFDEAMFQAASALEREDWKSAVTLYEQGLDKRNRDVSDDQRSQAEYRLAYALIRSGDVTRGIEQAERVALEQPATAASVQAAELALAAMWERWSASAENQSSDVGDPLQAFCQEVEARFASLSVADRARLLRGTLLARRGAFPDAARAFGAVQESSTDYPLARLRVGQMLARQYRKEPAAVTASDALAALTQAEAAYHSQTGAPDKPAQGAIDAAIEIAQLQFALGSPQAAADALAEYVQPLLAGGSGAGYREADLLATAIEAALAQDDFDSAQKLGSAILDRAQAGQGDAMTKVLVELGRRFRERIAAASSAGSRGEDVAEAFDRFLDRLAERPSLDSATLDFIGQSYLALEHPAKAATFFEKAIGQAEVDLARLSEEDRTRWIRQTRLRLLAAERRAGHFERAVKLGEQWSQETAGFAVDLAVEKARTLEAWSASEPSRWQETLKAWSDLANRLRTTRPRPAVYYEARLHTAQTLRKLGRPAEAIQVVRTTLATSSLKESPEMKDRLTDLLSELESGQKR